MLNVVSRIEELKANVERLEVARISCGIEDKGSPFINKISETFTTEVSKLVSLFTFNKDALIGGTKYKIAKVDRSSLYSDVKDIRNKEIGVYTQLLTPYKNKVEDIVLNSNLSLLNNTMIVVPMGMSVRMLDAITEVSKGVDICNEHLLPVLTELNLYISNPKSRSTVSKIDNRKGKDSVESINKTLKELLNNVVDINAKHQHLKFKKLYPVVTEFGKAYNNYMSLANIVNPEYLSKVLTLTDQISYKIEELIYQLKAESEENKVSTNTIKTLLKDTTNAADFVTLATSVFLMSDYLGQSILDVFNKSME